MEDETTEPGTEVEVLDDDQDVATEELDTDEPETESDEGDEDSEPELVELEIKGKTYKLPAELQDEFMLRPDYTRKTQEVAEQRKALEARLTEAAQVSETEQHASAHLIAIDAALEQYQAINWNALEQQNPMEAARLFREFTMLQSSRGEAEKNLTGARASREAETQRFNAERFQSSVAELARDIPEWGESKAQELRTFAEKQFGFTQDEFIEALHDARSIKLLNLAYAAVKSAAKTKTPAPQPKPASKVKGGQTPRKGLDDRLSTDDWLKERNRQLAKR